MKALEKERSRRYETANALSADVSRFLDDIPVLVYEMNPIVEASWVITNETPLNGSLKRTEYTLTITHEDLD